MEIEQFTLAIKSYKSKYSLDARGVGMFLKNNVDVNNQQIQQIQNKIQLMQYEQTYTDQIMQQILHIISCVQSGRTVLEIQKNQLRKYTKVTFISSKKNKPKNETKQQQNKKPQKMQQQINNQNVKNKSKMDQINQEKCKSNKQTNYNNKQNNKQDNFEQMFSDDENDRKQIVIDNRVIVQVKDSKDNKDSKDSKDSKDNNNNNNNNNIINNNNDNNSKGNMQMVNKSLVKSIIRAVADVNEGLGMINEDFRNEVSSDCIVEDNKKPDANYMSIDSEQVPLVIIEQYNKFNQDYINVVIKYKICHNNCSVWRRYSQFQKLMCYLNRKYQGIILPELPPKQGLKSNLSYFYGLDKQFLSKRQNKLQQLLNRLLSNKFVNQDSILLKFLDQPEFQLQNQQNNTLSYLKSFSEIAFNANELKDYGLAYYNYVRDTSDIQLNNQIVMQYKKINQLVYSFQIINEYRLKINQIYDRRRQIMNCQNLKCRVPQNTKLDKVLQIISVQIKNMHTEYNRYVSLKSTQSWYRSIVHQKNDQPATKYLEEFKKKLQQTQKRLKHMQSNLIQSMHKFQEEKQEQIKCLGGYLIEWKKKTHP